MTASITHIREQVAFALWDDDSIRAAQRQRTFVQWLDESEDTREKWRHAAQAALDAFHAEEREVTDRIRRLLTHCRPAHVTHQIEALLAKLDGKPSGGAV